MQPTLVLFDAMNLIRRVHAAQQSQGSSSEHLTATLFQCLNIINGILDKTQATHAVLVLDGKDPTWRHEIYPAYKANRAPMPEDLSLGLSTFVELCRKAGLSTLYQAQWEADDIMASISDKLCSHVDKIWIISTDKGLFQTLKPNVRVRSHFDRRTWEVADMQDEYGLALHQLVDYWALVGDTTNHIPGLTGVGKKTALQLLNDYGDIEGIVAHRAHLAPRVQRSLEQEALSLLTYRLLVKLSIRAPLGYNLSEWRLSGLTFPDRAQVVQAFNRVLNGEYA
jgi:protein Xni